MSTQAEAGPEDGLPPRTGDTPQLEADPAPREAINAIMAVMNGAFHPDFGEAWNHQQAYAMLCAPFCHSVVARDDAGDPLGFAMSRRIGPDEELLLIAVMPGRWSRGIGSLLMNHVVEAARDAGVETLFLEVRANNPAVFFYRNCGFEQIGFRKDYYRGAQGKRYDALTYALAL